MTLDPKKFTVPLVVVVSMLSFTAGAGAMYGAAKSKLEDTAAAVVEAKADVKKAQESVQLLEVAHAGDRADTQARLKNIEKALERIERWAGTK